MKKILTFLKEFILEEYRYHKLTFIWVMLWACITTFYMHRCAILTSKGVEVYIGLLGLDIATWLPFFVRLYPSLFNHECLYQEDKKVNWAGYNNYSNRNKWIYIKLFKYFRDSKASKDNKSKYTESRNKHKDISHRDTTNSKISLIISTIRQ